MWRSWGHSGAARQLMNMVLCLVWLMPQKHCIAEAKQRKTLENNWVRNYYMPDLERIFDAGEDNDNAYYFGMERVTTCIPPFATEPWHCPTWMKLDQGLTALLKPATCAGLGLLCLGCSIVSTKWQWTPRASSLSNSAGLSCSKKRDAVRSAVDAVCITTLKHTADSTTKTC